MLSLNVFQLEVHASLYVLEGYTCLKVDFFQLEHIVGLDL